MINEPDEKDFAYRNDKEAYNQDQDEWDNLIQEYEDQKELAVVDTINFGYGAFAGLRARLGDELGFEHKQDGWNLTITYDDQMPHAVELAAFFFHSDCDGELSETILKALDKVFREHAENLRKLKNVNVDKFVAFVEKSAKHNCYWQFG